MLSVAAAPCMAFAADMRCEYIVSRLNGMRYRSLVGFVVAVRLLNALVLRTQVCAVLLLHDPCSGSGYRSPDACVGRSTTPMSGGRLQRWHTGLCLGTEH